jgi:hypothetical protein
MAQTYGWSSIWLPAQRFASRSAVVEAQNEICVICGYSIFFLIRGSLLVCAHLRFLSGEALTDLLRDELHVRGFLDRKTNLGIHNLGKNRALVFGKTSP